jgi:CHAT domain-containing protein
LPHPGYLVETLRYRRSNREVAAAALIVGGVDYDAKLGAADPQPERRGGDDVLRGVKSAHWSSLPGTAAEKTGVAKVVSKKLVCSILGGKDATSAAVLGALPKARLAHVASHGFALTPAFRSAFQLDARLFRGTDAGELVLTPLLSSGLVFAGANESRTPGRGLVTGEAIVDLDLSGLELAVLSACETGLGEVPVNEGAMGIQRAFHFAGTRNVVGSLWKVPDQSTAALMAVFYENLIGKEMKPMEALRQAQLEIYRNPVRIAKLAAEFRGPFEEVPGSGASVSMNEARIEGANGKAHPRLWAAFVLSGVGR